MRQAFSHPYDAVLGVGIDIRRLKVGVYLSGGATPHREMGQRPAAKCMRISNLRPEGPVQLIAKKIIYIIFNMMFVQQLYIFIFERFVFVMFFLVLYISDDPFSYGFAYRKNSISSLPSKKIVVGSQGFEPTTTASFDFFDDFGYGVIARQGKEQMYMIANSIDANWNAVKFF